MPTFSEIFGAWLILTVPTGMLLVAMPSLAVTVTEIAGLAGPVSVLALLYLTLSNAVT